MTFDITSLEIADSGKYHVTNAKGDPQYDTKGNPITITVTSPGTKKATRAQFKRDEARSARVVGQMAGKNSKRTEDDEVRERAGFLAEITESLDGFSYAGGPVELYKNLKLGHIADGVEKYFNDRGNFSVESPGDVSNMSATSHG